MTDKFINEISVIKCASCVISLKFDQTGTLAFRELVEPLKRRLSMQFPRRLATGLVVAEVIRVYRQFSPEMQQLVAAFQRTSQTAAATP